MTPGQVLHACGVLVSNCQYNPIVERKRARMANQAKIPVTLFNTLFNSWATVLNHGTNHAAHAELDRGSIDPKAYKNAYTLALGRTNEIISYCAGDTTDFPQFILWEDSRPKPKEGKRAMEDDDSSVATPPTKRRKKSKKSKKGKVSVIIFFLTLPRVLTSVQLHR